MSNFKRMPLKNLASVHPGSAPMLIRDHLPYASIGVIFGDPGGGKTTLAADIACHIDTGLEWRGKRVNPGVVWYIAAEDPYGVRLRMEAWYQAHGLNFSDTRIEIIEDAICFAEPANVDKLIADVKEAAEKPVLIIIDTLVDTAGKYDLNKDMGSFMTGFERFRNETRTGILTIHHCGHAAKDRPRNGSELGGKCDVIMPVKCDDTGITTLSCTKIKNCSKEKAKPLSWKLKGIQTKWLDSDGEIITSVVLEPTEYRQHSETEALGDKQRLALDILKRLYAEHCGNLDAGDCDSKSAMVRMSDWQKAMIPVEVDSGNRSTIRKALIDRGLVIQQDMYVKPVML